MKKLSDESIEEGEVTDDSEEEDQVDANGMDVEEKMKKKLMEKCWSWSCQRKICQRMGWR